MNFLAAALVVFILDIIPPLIPGELMSALWITNSALSVATTLLCSLIIVARIFIVSRLPGATRQPIKAAEIVIESAAFYSITTLIWIPIFNTPSAVTYAIYVDVFYTLAIVCGIFLFASLNVYLLLDILEPFSSPHHAPSGTWPRQA
jgi:hypothetical protein